MDSTRIEVLGAHRLRIAIALELLNRKPAHLSIKDYISDLRAVFEVRKSAQKGNESTAKSEKAKDRAGDIACDAARSSVEVEPNQLDDVPSRDIADADAIKAAQSLSPTIAQIVTLLSASHPKFTSQAAVSELLRLLSDLLSPELPEEGGEGATRKRDGEAWNSSLLLCWLNGSARLEYGSKQQETQIGSQLVAVLSSLTSNYPMSLLLPATLLPQALDVCLESINSSGANLSLPSLTLSPLAEQTLSTFAELIRQLSQLQGQTEQVEKAKEKLLSLVRVCEMLVEWEPLEGGPLAQQVRDGLTRIIAELGVDELVGPAVEERVLSVLS